VSDARAHEVPLAANPRPSSEVALRNAIVILMVFATSSAMFAGLFLYTGATAIEMGGIATFFGMLEGLVAIVLLVASAVVYLILSAIRRRNGVHRSQRERLVSALSVSQLVDCRLSSGPERGYPSAVTLDTPGASVAAADSPPSHPTMVDPLIRAVRSRQFARFLPAFDAGSALDSDRAGLAE